MTGELPAERGKGVCPRYMIPAISVTYAIESKPRGSCQSLASGGTASRFKELKCETGLHICDRASGDC